MYNSISQERINLSYNTRNIKKRKFINKMDTQEYIFEFLDKFIEL